MLSSPSPKLSPQTPAASLTLLATQLRQVEVEHGSQAVTQLRPQEGIWYLLGEVVHHVHRLPGQSQVGSEPTVRELEANSFGLTILVFSGGKIEPWTM